MQRLLLPALAREPGRPLSADYRRRHDLPGALDGAARARALEREELVGRERGDVRIVEPFLAEWVRERFGGAA